MINKALFSSNSDEWATPDNIFKELDSEFSFNLDACATQDNHKCPKFFTKEDDGLAQNWGGYRLFVNPPYSNIGAWIKKAYYESFKPNTLIVLLIPARTDTRYFQEYIYHRAEIRFIKGRLHFNNSKAGAPFPSMLVIYRAGGLKE